MKYEAVIGLEVHESVFQGVDAVAQISDGKQRNER